MRSSLNLSRLCQSQLMLMAIIFACMVASHQNSRLRRISILLTDTLNLHSMASCVIFSGLTQWMTAKQERCALAKRSKRVFSQIRTGTSQRDSSHEQLHLYHSRPSSISRWLQDASLGRPSGFPISHHSFQCSKLLWRVPQQGRCYFDRKR